MTVVLFASGCDLAHLPWHSITAFLSTPRCEELQTWPSAFLPTGVIVQLGKWEVSANEREGCSVH